MVGICIRLTPLRNVSAEKLAKSPITPPPKAIMVKSLPYLFFIKKSCIFVNELISLYFSPSGSTKVFKLNFLKDFFNLSRCNLANTLLVIITTSFPFIYFEKSILVII